MRNIRVADPRDRTLEPPVSPQRAGGPSSRAARARDWIATAPILLLIVAFVLPLAMTSAAGPTLKARPGNAQAGAVITVSGMSFGKAAKGELVWDDEVILGTFAADRRGAFKAQVTLPADAAAGDHTIHGLSGGTVLATVTVSLADIETVAEPTPAPTAPPTPAPTLAPTPTPTAAPSTVATTAPTSAPSASASVPPPTASPTATATTAATPRPSTTAAAIATPAPTAAPTAALTTTVVAPQPGTILIDRATLLSLPTTGTAWAALKARADLPAGRPNLSDQNDPNDVTALAKALVYARTGVTRYRDETVAMLKGAVGTEYPGDALGVARGVAPLVLAADLVGWRDPAWMSWLSNLRTWANPDRGFTLVSMHNKRPNNWGTHAGAGRIAADLYLGDMTDLARAARVFEGYLGNRAVYAGFSYGADLSWQANPLSPVGINPRSASIAGVNVDGIMPDDMRRGGSRPIIGDAGQMYTWEALQGTLLQAELLARRGYSTWAWQDRAILRAFTKINSLGYPATGDDTWQPWLVNKRYGTSFGAAAGTSPGKSFGYADWLYSR